MITTENLPKVIVFDFDGVIVESNSIKTEAFEHLFSRFPEHYNAMMAFHYENISATRFVKFDYLLKRLQKTTDTSLRSELGNQFSAFVEEAIKNVALVDGALRLLDWLADRCTIYLASVTPDEELKRILRHRNLINRFKAVFGCPPWTKVQAIQHIQKNEEVSTDEIMLIGDSAGDQRAAAETGIRFLARDSGLRFDEPPPQMFPDLISIKAYLVKCQAN